MNAPVQQRAEYVLTPYSLRVAVSESSVSGLGVRGHGAKWRQVSRGQDEQMSRRLLQQSKCGELHCEPIA